MVELFMHHVFSCLNLSLNRKTWFAVIVHDGYTILFIFRLSYCPTKSPISLMSWGHKYCTCTSESWIIAITSFSFFFLHNYKQQIIPAHLLWYQNSKLTFSIQDKSTAHEVNCSVAYDLCHHNHFCWFPMVFVCAFNMGAHNGTVVSATSERSLKNHSCDKSQWPFQIVWYKICLYMHLLSLSLSHPAKTNAVKQCMLEGYDVYRVPFLQLLRLVYILKSLETMLTR